MGERQWKPGDVADLTYSTIDGGRAIRVAGGSCEKLHPKSDHWHFASGSYGDGSMSSDIRPVVVIDPEDREGVERLIADYARKVPNGYWTPDEGDDHDMSTFVESMQAALREFANPTPPKPDEPMGLGAVVEDAGGVRWVRDCPDDRPGDDDWRMGGSSVWHFYKDIDVVRVLSEGIQ